MEYLNASTPFACLKNFTIGSLCMAHNTKYASFEKETHISFLKVGARIAFPVDGLLQKSGLICHAAKLLL